jgi:hypothetical protein
MSSNEEELREVANKIWRSFHSNRLPTVECASRGPDWRANRIRAVRRVARRQHERLLKYLGSAFGATRIDELSDMQLDVAWREVSNW